MSHEISRNAGNPGEVPPPNYRQLADADSGLPLAMKAPESAEEDRDQLSALGFSVRTA